MSCILSLSQATSSAQGIIFLKDIDNVSRTDLKPYCIEIGAKDRTTYMVR